MGMVFVDGFTAYHDRPGASPKYGALGPLSDGDIIRRVLVTVILDQAETFGFAPALCRSPSATLENLDSGVPLISRSDETSNVLFGSTPAVRDTFSSTGTMRFEFFPGARVSGGPGWIIYEYFTGAVFNVGIMLSFEIWRNEKRRDDDR
ncbi:MAG: hypothetical protein ACE5HE_12475 [Phycisphaerae bacterium]